MSQRFLVFVVPGVFCIVLKLLLSVLFFILISVQRIHRGTVVTRTFSLHIQSSLIELQRLVQQFGLAKFLFGLIIDRLESRNDIVCLS